MGQAGRILPTMTVTFLGVHLVLGRALELSPVQPLSWVLLVSLTTHFCHTSQSNWQMARYCFIEQWKKTALNDYLKTFSQLMRHTLTELLFFFKKSFHCILYANNLWMVHVEICGDFLCSCKRLSFIYKDYLYYMTIALNWSLWTSHSQQLWPSISRCPHHLQGSCLLCRMWPSTTVYMLAVTGSCVVDEILMPLMFLQPIPNTKKKIAQIFFLPNIISTL